ncbi:MULTISPECIES: 4'-phosphopantetheinyl transferase family protein [unclassified Brevibacterium]|uniref:4'-phosphopantetheinyl transferase family protein n=1 Tax=unclassified Brevibacterium TaxID=2614124 RepID=UPI00109249E1|nr:4'-phosphopantetheinyl transferase superfamily protein [Brevibacterium sp. S22]TGD29726.1 4'-phosphopantetheinyl transferase superfamily protein [Brevibacterium sp. S22]
MTSTAIEYLISDIAAIDRVLTEHPWLDTLLSADEAARADRFRRRTDRDAYRGAHLLFRLMAARRLGIDLKEAGDLALTRRCRTCGGPHGKPEVPGAELSLSRSNDTVVIASAPASSPIGVDIEQVPSDVFSGFDDYVINPSESLPDGEDPVRQRIDLWVGKEAAVKTTGHGLSVPPGDLTLKQVKRAPSRSNSDRQWTASISAPEVCELDALNISSLPSPRGYAAALCCAQRPPIEAVSLLDIVEVLPRLGRSKQTSTGSIGQSRTHVVTEDRRDAVRHRIMAESDVC